MDAQSLPTSAAPALRADGPSNSNALRTAVFIDGAHLGKTLRHSYPGVLIDHARLAALLAVPGHLQRAYYYDSLPYLEDQPSVANRAFYDGRKRFFDSLRELPSFEVREGVCVKRWNQKMGQYVYAQKRVDNALSVDLVRLASKNRIDVAVLVTGDSDFVPAVEAARQEGVQVRLLCSPNPREVHADLMAAVDERMTLDARTVDAIRIRGAA